jgi:EAL domain-containing protein (putative c-di-GMP-specific phosphodiesterase class I)
MVLADVDDISAITHVIERVQASLMQPVALRGMQVVTSLSIGVALYPRDGEDFDELLKHAELAMYQAKSSGRNGYCFFDAQLNRDSRERLALEMGLRQALRHKQFVLHYQPIMDIRSGALLGAEALVRWQHPERGLLGPDTFIGIAERSGLIVEIGDWVLNEACCQMHAWHAAGLPRVFVSVNLSGMQFQRADVVQLVDAALQRSGLPAEYLELELTESILLQGSEPLIEVLQRLNALGVKLSIDDFGTGYSSLAYLQRFQVDKLKIDQSFVRGIRSDERDAAIVNAIIQMARILHLVTTAEGIEDVETCQRLAELGCDQAQGYLFARPLAAEAFAAFARQAASVEIPG